MFEVNRIHVNSGNDNFIDLRSLKWLLEAADELMHSVLPL